MADRRARDRLNRRAGLAAVAVAALLVLMKGLAFAATGALSVAAALADSLLDLAVSGTALLAIRYAAKPPDEDHAFGHTSAEDLTALAQALLIGGSGVAIGAAALWRLWQGAPPPLQAEALGLALMGLATALTGALVLYQRHVARRTGNRIVAADSLHYLGDLIPNLGAMAALMAAGWGGLERIDSLVALAASAVMIGGAARIGKGAVDALMDRKAPAAIEAGIADLARSHPGVRGFHDLKTRQSGSHVFVTLHIELDGDQTLHAAHDIGAALRLRILAAYPQADVTIHKDVWHPPLSAPPDLP